MAEVLPTMRRAEPYTWQRTFEHIPWLIASFWGVFVAVIAPPFYLDATRWFMLIGFAGLLFGLVLAAVYLRRTHRRPSLRRPDPLPRPAALAGGGGRHGAVLDAYRRVR